MLLNSFAYYTDEVTPEEVIENCHKLPWKDDNGHSRSVTDLVREAVLDLARPELPKDEYKFTHEAVDFFYMELEMGLHLPSVEGLPIKVALKELERFWDGQTFEFGYVYRSDWHGGDSVHVSELSFKVNEMEEWN